MYILSMAFLELKKIIISFSYFEYILVHSIFFCYVKKS